MIDYKGIIIVYNYILIIPLSGRRNACFEAAYLFLLLSPSGYSLGYPMAKSVREYWD